MTTQGTSLVLVVGMAMAGCGGAALSATAGETPAGDGTATATGADSPTVPPSVGGAGGLVIGGSEANFGVHSLAAGFTPDPRDISVVSGGDLDASTLGLGSDCKGWLTRQPDIIVQLTQPSNMLRFYVTAGSDDTTLVVNAADGTYHCNDDSYSGRNPTVDLRSAGAGQYDIWVGSYESGVRANGVLHITELDAHHP